MSTLIQIKRTQNASLPSQTGGQLHSGELAYLYDTSNSASANNENGKRLLPRNRVGRMQKGKTRKTNET